MHLNPVYIGTLTTLLLMLLVFLITGRIKHGILAGRELMYLLGQDSFEYILIDIRRSQDYQKGHIPGAANVPYPGCLEHLPTENMFEKIYIYGKSRYRAREVAKSLSKTGYFNVSYFGAFRAWKGPVEKDGE